MYELYTYQLTFFKFSFRVPKNLILITEDVIVNIKLIRHRTLDKYNVNNKQSRNTYDLQTFSAL